MEGRQARGSDFESLTIGDVNHSKLKAQLREACQDTRVALILESLTTLSLIKLKEMQLRSQQIDLDLQLDDTQ